VTVIGTHLWILFQWKYNESLINSNRHNKFLTDPIEHENDRVLIVRIKNMYIQLEMLLQILQGVIRRQDTGETRPPGTSYWYTSHTLSIRFLASFSASIAAFFSR
jgi:hypothetical protein